MSQRVLFIRLEY